MYFPRALVLWMVVPWILGCAAGVVGVGGGDLVMDPLIENGVEDRLAQDPVLMQREITVHANAGVVTLRGKVATQQEALRAQSLAEEVFGVRVAVSELEVASKETKPAPGIGTRKPAGTRVCSDKPREPAAGRARITGQGLNVRTGAGTHCSRIGGFGPDDEFTLMGKRGNWYQVRAESGMVGWVYGPYIKRMDPIVKVRSGQ